MKPQYQQRYQIYKLDSVTSDARLATVTPGTLLAGIEFQMEPDAPFLLRGYCFRVKATSLDGRTQTGLQNIAMRYTGPDQDYRSAQLVPQNLVVPYGGQSSAWRPVYPQIFYPARSTMTLDILNASTTATLTDVSIYLIGVKLFPWDSMPAYTYPRKMRATQYGYGINYMSPQPSTNPTAAVQNLMATDDRRLQVFQVKNDADFVVRTIQCGPSYSPFAAEVFITLRDENRKAYSNAGIHFEVLGGPSLATYQTGSAGTIGAVGTGNSMPGVIFPELYLPKNHIMYYDIKRADAGFAGNATILNFPITLLGSRVYEA